MSDGVTVLPATGIISIGFQNQRRQKIISESNERRQRQKKEFKKIIIEIRNTGNQ